MTTVREMPPTLRETCSERWGQQGRGASLAGRMASLSGRMASLSEDGEPVREDGEMADGQGNGSVVDNRGLDRD